MYARRTTDALSIRELRANIAQVVNQAEAGEITVITRKGERVGAVVRSRSSTPSRMPPTNCSPVRPSSTGTIPP
ncbi:type II toxin-antitoxin system prevent-host-death family antitoxin [Kitasatospora sp. NPDC091276]|uniref:type II toxin-antitoxin system Phd/YefM family antitoxin n=1 Tax=Kitasatospora sp. NPDC091276 TaxID=3155300 RepID=UPI003433A39F